MTPKPRRKPRNVWNRCDICGRFVSYADFDAKLAARWMETPDSEVSGESWRTEHLACSEASMPEPFDDVADERCLL